MGQSMVASGEAGYVTGTAVILLSNADGDFGHRRDMLLRMLDTEFDDIVRKFKYFS